MSVTWILTVTVRTSRHMHSEGLGWLVPAKCPSQTAPGVQVPPATATAPATSTTLRARTKVKEVHFIATTSSCGTVLKMARRTGVLSLDYGPTCARCTPPMSKQMRQGGKILSSRMMACNMAQCCSGGHDLRICTESRVYPEYSVLAFKSSTSMVGNPHISNSSSLHVKMLFPRHVIIA
jgi:hypothetical protein